MCCHFLLLVCIDIKGSRVAVAAVAYELFCFIKGFLKAVCAVHGKDRGELFMCKFLRDVDGCDLTDQDLCCLRDFHACQGSDLIRALSDDLGIQRAVDDNRLPDLLDLFRSKEIASAVRELSLYFVIDIVQDSDGLL